MTRSPEARRRAPDLRADPPRSVLLVRLSARGDVVFATPLVRAFKRTFPDVRITWVAEPHTVDLIQHHPLLDEVLVWPRQELKALLKRGRLLAVWRRVRAFRRLLHERHFDLAIDLQGLLKSASLVFISGARTRVGVGSREFADRLVHYDFFDPDLSRVSSQYHELARCLGLETDGFAMEVAVSDEDARFAAEWARSEGLQDGYAVLIPFTTWPQKHWVAERWAEVAHGLERALGLPSVLLGGPSDRAAAEPLLAQGPSSLRDLVGRTRLGQASAIVRGARLAIGVDTGLTHIALAFDRPTVCIFGASLPYESTPTERGIILREDIHCAPCWRNPVCNGLFTCMHMVTTHEVLEAAKGRLAFAEGGAGAEPA
ncbi:MAG: glycosyltransferase family 9 protein [Gemmatimonadota bacterium]